jgi:hypothetical protein
LEAKMRKLMTAAMAAITLGGAVMATAAPAEAQPRHHSYYRGYNRHNGSGAAVAAGVAGLAIGAALAGSNHNRGYYDNGYYGGGYAYDRGYYAPRVCESNRWVFDPYIGRRVLVRDRYRC